MSGATSWDVIRFQVVKGRPGTAGEAADLSRAVRLFNALQTFLVDKDEARLSILAEPGIVGALSLSGELEEIGILEPDP